MFNFNSLAVLVFGFLLQAQGLKCAPYADTSANGKLCLEEVCITKGQLSSLLGLLGVKGTVAPAIYAKNVDIANWNILVNPNNGNLAIRNDLNGAYVFSNSTDRFNFEDPKFNSVTVGNWKIRDNSGNIAAANRDLLFFPIGQPESVYRMRNQTVATNLWEKAGVSSDLTLKTLKVGEVTIGGWKLALNKTSIELRDTAAKTDARYSFTAGRWVDV
jgi:hypothetical protein